MIQLATHTELPPQQNVVKYSVPILMIGSCFTNNIGNKLKEAFFDVDINPFGETYNPLSICAELDRLAAGNAFTKSEIEHHGGLWHSMMHHGEFSNASPQITLQNINNRLEAAASLLTRNPVIIITLGTAYAYERNGIVVNNCHKMPANNFTRRRLGIDEIADRLAASISKINYSHCILTVSPIRHLRDGAHDNQTSKATLLLAADKLVNGLPDTTYFPAYEIMLDELRDYRFYDEDMTHPTPLAVKYIFERFEQTFMDDHTRERMTKCQRLRQRINHRLMHPNTEEAKQFETETKKMAAQLGIKLEEDRV